MKALNVVWLDRVYSPLVTLWMFLGQVLSQDHSYRAAVARLIAHRVARGQRPCSTETSAYCQTRKRLPEELFAAVARKTGQALDERAHDHWLWKGRRVLAYDGPTVSMAKGDHIVEWRRPGRIRSIDWQTLKLLPEQLTIRETRVRIQQPGFRCRSMIVVSMLLDAEEVTAHDLAELDLRSLKQTMQMDILRCKTPELVRQEIGTHLLADNLIRTLIAQAASKHRLEPRTVSFKGAVQILKAFQPLIATQGDCSSTRRQRLYEQLLDAVATHQVGDRPDRFEPRQRKRRQKKYDRMM